LSIKANVERSSHLLPILKNSKAALAAISGVFKRSGLPTKSSQIKSPYVLYDDLNVI